MKDKIYWLGVGVCTMLIVYLVVGFSMPRQTFLNEGVRHGLVIFRDYTVSFGGFNRFHCSMRSTMNIKNRGTP